MGTTTPKETPTGGSNPTAGDTHSTIDPAIVDESTAHSKRFATLAARAALAGHQFTQARGGYMLTRGAVSRHFADLDTADALIRRMEGSTA